MFFKLLLKMKNGTEDLNYGRVIIKEWSNIHLANAGEKDINILDVGLGKGDDLINIRSNNNKKCLGLYGVECYPPNIEIAKKNQISIVGLNIENDRLPFKDGFFDIIVANQVIEHTKEVFWIFSEMSRVLRNGGIIIIGVPNLASLHNRIALLLGNQPTSIRMAGPHVRGITKNTFKEFIEQKGFFRLIEVKGANFYPFSEKVSNILSRLLPNLSVSLFFLIQRTDRKGCFIEVLKDHFFETPYYCG